jgi:alkylation response protein AidB-like acyl-CoA dehydrogenase
MTLEREGIEREVAAAADSLIATVWPVTARREWLRDRAFPVRLWKEAADSGWFDLLVPEADGGLGRSAVEACAVTEATGRHLVPGPFVDTIVLSPAMRRLSNGGADPAILCLLHAAGTRGRAANGRAGVRGGAVFAQRLTGEWAVSADQLVVDAGESVVVVDAADERVHRTPLDGRDAFRQPCLVDIDGAPIVGVIAGGRAAAEVRAAVRRLALVMTASELLGVAQRMLEMSLEYAMNRHQFGRSIGSFQAVQHRLADMTVTVESMRSVCYLAQVAARDDDAEADTLAMVAKAHTSAGAREVAEAALQVHGGIGFTADCDLSLYLLRALSLQSAWGDDRAWCRALGRSTLATAAASAEAGSTPQNGERLDGRTGLPGEAIAQLRPSTDGAGGEPT